MHASLTIDRMALTPDRLIFDLRSTATPQISADGTRVAYIQSETERGTATTSSHLWLLDIASGETRQLTQTGTSTSDPVWSPDNTAIAFVSKRGEDAGFATCVLPIDGGEARIVTRHTTRPGGLAWSPSGDRLAYTVSVDPKNPTEAPREAGAPPAVRAIRRIDYKQDSRGYLNDVRQQVMVVEVASGERRQVSSELFDHGSPQWSSDGSKLAVKISNRNGMHSELAILPVEGGETIRVGWNGGGIGTWRWSQDDSFILFDGYPRSSPQTEFYRFDLASGETTQLTDDMRISPVSGRPTISGPDQPFWLDDTTALIHAEQAGRSGLWTIDAQTGTLDEVVSWDAAHAGLSVSADGSRIVQVSNDPSTTGQIVLYDRSSNETRVLVDPNAALFAESPPATCEQFTIDRDGWKIDAWLYKPADFDETTQYPLVLDVHGGPHGHYGYAFNLGAQVLAPHGILVVASNPRGSGTYGREFGEAVRGDWGGEDWKDLQAVLAEVESRPYVDADRTGIYGYSYGGYMTSWAIGQTDRFKAAVCGAPVFNMLSFYGTSDIGHVFGESQWGGGPQEVGEWMVERSPSTHIHKAVTPTLIVHGEADDRCPIGQGEELFVGLLKAGVETEFVRYPGGSHMMLRNGPIQHRIDYYTRMLTWFQHHLA